MKFCSVTIPAHLYPNVNKYTRRSLVAAEIATMSYFTDVKTNIRLHAERLIKLAVASNDEQALAGAKVRKRSLAKFLKGRNPLSYSVLVYPDLIRSVNPPGVHLSLQISDTKSMSTLELAALMYNMTKPTNPIPVQAPFFCKSPCIGVFREAVAFIQRQASLAQVADVASFVKSVLAMMFDEKEIAHVPWTAPLTPHTIGRPSKKVVFDFYRSTSKLQEIGERAMMQVVSAEEEALMADTRLADSAALSNPKSPWCINALTIGELPTVLHKQGLPSDFTLEQASLTKCEAYITETYEWVVKHYNGALPLHKFALLAAHMFSRIAPRLTHPPPPSNVKAMPLSAMTQHVRAAPWVEHDKRSDKGLTASLPFVVMVTTTIIAMSDPTSPLRDYIRKNKGSQGPWARKHGESRASRLTFRTPPLISIHSR